MSSFQYQLEDIDDSIPTEEERLNLQARMKAYSLDQELKSFDLRRNGIILDAGCGTGNALKWLAHRFPGVELHGCDISDINLKKAQSHCSQAHLFRSDLSSLDIEDNTYDYVLNRYVYEYLEHPQEVANEFHRVLKPEGTVNIVAVDGLMRNFHSTCHTFNTEIVDVFNKVNVDLDSGRKVPFYLSEAGFSNVKTALEAHVLEGTELETEMENIKIRFQKAKEIFLSVMTEKEYVRFCEKYIEELSKKGTVYFFNKFLVRGSK